LDRHTRAFPRLRWGAMSEDDFPLQERLDSLVRSAASRPGLCVFLTGAGISAESGVPTFRGPQGYWREGSRNYHPEELATQAAFRRMPETVWRWYLHRSRVCASALPNVAHRAIAAVARELGDRFLLITQNVDGLHARAGCPRERTYEIHGNIAFMRCSVDCQGLVEVPAVSEHASDTELRRMLCCPSCGALARPHVLWFDEFYDEPLFRFESALRAAESLAVLVVVGTTGTTNLPLAIGRRAASLGTPLVVIDPEPNPFSELVTSGRAGLVLKGTAGRWVPAVASALTTR
jgi:NAD-dependent deacetylase